MIFEHVPPLWMAAGTSAEGVAKVKEYLAAGVRCPILYALMDNSKPVWTRSLTPAR